MAFTGDFNAAAAVDYTTPHVASVSGPLNQAVMAGARAISSGNVYGADQPLRFHLRVGQS